MDGISYSILVPYKEKIVLAKVEEDYNALDILYKVKFPDGYQNIFYTIEVDEEKGWAELNLGPTQLAVDVGKALDEYKAKE